MVALTSLIFVFLLIATAPLAYAMGLGSAIALAAGGSTPMVVIVQRMFAGTDSLTLLAVPFYILAGNLMEEVGISAQLVRLARALVGHIRGSLGIVTVVAEYFFSGISGSTSADVSAIGSVLIPSMKRVGYRGEDAVAIVAAATSMGSLVPPSLGMIVLASIMELSVGAVFVAGFLPAMAIALVLIALIYGQGRRLGLPVERRASLQVLMAALRGSITALLMPIIIFGGILGGVTTATEAGALACLYGLLVGVVSKRLSPARLYDLLLRSAYLTGVVMFLVASATLFAWILATEQVPRKLGAVVFSVSQDPVFFLAMAIVIFIVVGAVLEGIPAMLVLVPVFYPMATTVGIHPLHFAIVSYAAVNVGIFLPPIGVGFLLSAAIGRVSVERATVAFVPYLVALVVGLAVVAAIPSLTLVLPEVTGLMKR